MNPTTIATAANAIPVAKTPPIAPATNTAAAIPAPVAASPLIISKAEYPKNLPWLFHRSILFLLS